jgi:UDP-N-acetylglucosamine 4-epimerase
VVHNSPAAGLREPIYRDFRPGDIRHSLADISKAQQLLGYGPKFSVKTGLEKAAKWYQSTRNMD